jgi:DNA-binding response OmpR family regulator
MQRHLAEGPVDLIVLDVMLPGDDGFTLCRAIREHSQVPIIMLTASSDETDRVVGLELGADDYLAKPFSARELQARIKALLRRARFARDENPRFVRFDRWRLDTLAHELVDTDGARTPLSGADFALLQLFLNHPNQVLDRDTISDVTRGRESLPLDRVVDVAVSRLRQRLGDQGRQPKLIKTVRGQGYLLTATVSHGND